jgi:PucR family transcriptional regulator, purine catabolism regulatory protein
MSLTVRDLVATAELDLRLLVEGRGLDRAVTWVHVSELRDPTPFLSGGELLLTTGLTFGGPGGAGDPGEQESADEYVHRLGEAAVVGLGFGTGLSHMHVPAELTAAARRRGLPIVEVPRHTPFIAISRAVSRAVAADEYAAVTRTFTAQQALTKAALAADGPGRLVRLLAAQLGGWVVLLDPAGAPIAAHPEPARSTVDVLAAEMMVLAAHRGPVSSGFPLGNETVGLQSVGAGPRGRAFLAVGKAGQLTAADRHLVNAAVMLLTIRLEQSSTTDRGLRGLRSALLRLVISGQVGAAEPIADELSTPLPRAPVTVLVAIGDVGEAGSRLQDASTRSSLVGRMLVAELDDALVVLVDGGRDAANDVATRLTVATGGDVVAVGVSASVGYSDIAAAYRQASRAASFGLRNLRPVTGFDQISMPGITGMLGRAEAVAFAESLLRPLLDHDRSGRGDLVLSLREWLAHHGQWDPSATALGVHRHTLRHRMNSVEELLGRSLDSPGTRSELWLALEILDGR